MFLALNKDFLNWKSLTLILTDVRSRMVPVLWVFFFFSCFIGHEWKEQEWGVREKFFLVFTFSFLIPWVLLQKQLLTMYISIFLKNLFLEEMGANRVMIILMPYLINRCFKLIVFQEWNFFNNFSNHIWDINKHMLCICAKMS